jgi:hypothetical protein
LDETVENDRPACLHEVEVVESKLDAADVQAMSMATRYGHDQVFGSIREDLHGAGGTLR